jgi:hypothetical protein
MQIEILMMFGLAVVLWLECGYEPRPRSSIWKAIKDQKMHLMGQ